MNETAGKWKTRILIIGLFLLFFSPILMSWYLVVYTDYKPAAGAGVQHGTLINPPRLLQNVSLKDPVLGTAVPLHGKWTMMNIVKHGCELACRDNFYRMRQIRLATGNEMQKLQRATYFPDQNAVDAVEGFVADYPGHLLLAGDIDESFLSAFTGTGQNDENTIFLIDPQGFLMMVYPADTEPSGIIRDLKKLLRISRAE